MLDVELYKLLDVGHFWCKPYSRDKRKAEQYFTLIGKINDYCNSNEQKNNPKSSSAYKGQVCLVKRTSDRCWYRARILSVFQTINGPQARVLLVDLGERTLVPEIWIQEIPEDFLSIPFQTMECVLSGLKPTTLTTSYFDLTISKQPGDSWDIAATEWFKKEIHSCSLQIDIKHIDEDGVHHVLLFATGPNGMICINDELVNKDFAVLSKTVENLPQDQNKAENSNQDMFLEEHKEIIEKLNSSLGMESDSSDSLRSSAFSKDLGHRSKGKYQPITDTGFASPDASPQRNGIEPNARQNLTRTSDGGDTTGKVRFLSARLPATGSSPLSDSPPGTKQLRPILKNSSGYSSSDHDDGRMNRNSDTRLPRENSKTSWSPHDSTTVQSNTGPWRPSPSGDQQGHISRKYEQNATSTTRMPPRSSENLVPQNSFEMQNQTTAGPPQTMLNSPNSALKPKVSPYSSPSVPIKSSLTGHSPYTRTNPPQSSQASSSPHYPHLPVSPQQSPSVPTPSTSRSPRIPASPLPSPMLCHVSKDVFIHGECPPRTINQIDSNTFSEILLRALRDLGVTSPTSFQCNIWPAILRGRDVCAIPESGTHNSLAYLLPVVAQITEPQAYSELPLGNGPLAIVLCSDWRKAEEIYNTCFKLTKKFRTVRVQMLYAAGHEDEHILHLINGCEVIIATVPCFLRMLQKGYTRLDRLCHLVFDGADILAEERTEDIKEIMRSYGGLLVSNPSRLAPRQCIAVAAKWTNGVSSLVKAYLGNPLIVIGNPLEAAMFCNVQQVAEFTGLDMRDKILIGLVDSLSSNVDHEIIIFTSATKDAERVAGILEHEAYSALLAHEFLRPEHLKEIHRQWNTPHCSQSYPIIVMTDGVINECNVRNASCIIHYDFPASKALFGRRLLCMSASYPSTKEKPCLSMLLVTDIPLVKFAHSIKELVIRSGGETPAKLEPVITHQLQVKEEKKKRNDLCYFLKALGVCKNSSTCKERHTVFADVDVSVLLPRSGIVKILVLKVWDACHYYVRILEHKSDSKRTGDESSNYYSGATFLKLALDLNAWYALPANCRICGVIQPHKICVAYSEGSFYRVKIVRVVKEDPETNRALEVEVFFVDRGFYDDVSTRHLMEIAPQFVDIPFQAVEAFVGRVKPLDEERAWTFKSDRFVKQNIEGKELEGRVVMGLRDSIWLDPLVVKTYLKEINVTTNVFNVRLDLLKEGLAVANPQHFDNLKKHFQSFQITMKDLTGQDESERYLNFDPLVETAVLLDEGFTSVKVPAVVNPGLFYVRLDENSDRLADVADVITEEMDKVSPRTACSDLVIGSLCVAKFTEDNEWYRGKIISIRPEGEYEVFFVDYGDREWISQDKIVAPWPEILELPFQAIECSLANISPVENEWTEGDTDLLLAMTGEKVLYAKVKSKSTAMFAGTCCYSVELYDTTTECDVLLNHELVSAGHAQATLAFHKTLFPEAFQTQHLKRQKQPFEEIPDICLQIYKSQDGNMKLQLAKEIKDIVSELNTQSDVLRESGSIRCICRLLGVTKSETVQEYIIITLAILASKDEQNSDEIRREGGLKAICYLLTKTKSVKILEHAAWALKNLATNDRNRDEVRELGAIRNICLLLETDNNEKVQENICWAIVALCADNNKNCDTIREVGGIEKLFTLLKNSCNDSVLENVLWAISVLACNTKNKKHIGEQGGIEIICNLIINNQNEKVFANAIRSLKTLSSYNDENREIMYRLGIVDVMRRLTEYTNTLPFDTRRLCLDLIQRLLGRAPHIPLIEATSMTSPLQESITAKPLYVTKKRQETMSRNGVSSSDEDELPPLEDAAEQFLLTVHPMTMWSQTKRYVTLSIKLRDVTEKVARMTEKTFYFKTKHLGKVYELNMELFAAILPKESKVHVRGSEVLVNLKKSQPSTWQRLLAQTEKPPYLSVDFDRWDTDSSNEDETRGPRVRVPLTTKSTSTKLDYTLPREHEDNSESDFTDEEDTQEQFFDFS